MTDAAARLPASFRDPSGFLFTVDGTLYRQVNERFADDFDAFISSGCYDALVAEGLLVPHAEAGLALAPAPGAHRVLEPERIPFVSYPYEWCVSQLRDAARLTLAVQRIALAHGLCLRDASAYNVQFRGARPVFIDTLSFERLVPDRPWAAYGQFCRHFLAPLALMSTVDARLGQLLRVHVDGIPLDLAARLLPTATRMRPGLGLHLHQHAKAQQRHAGDRGAAAAAKARGFSKRALEGLVDSLDRTVAKLDWEPPDSAWTAYYDGDSYAQAAFEHKQRLVADLVERVAPASVWDLGANTGVYSALAAERGAYTVAFEQDPATVEHHYRARRREASTRVLPLVTDLANPSPGLGWAGQERDALADRGPADLVLALALVHHIALGNNVPLPEVAAFLARLGRALVIEFVPKGDPKVELLLASREDIFDDYHADGFEAAFAPWYEVEARAPIEGSARVLYLLRSRAAS